MDRDGKHWKKWKEMARNGNRWQGMKIDENRWKEMARDGNR